MVMAGIVVAMGVGMFWESWAFYHDLLDPWVAMFCWAWAYLLAAVAAWLFVRMQDEGRDEVFPEIPDFFLDRPALTAFAVAGLVSYPSVMVAWFCG